MAEAPKQSINKFWVASVVPLVALVWPFLSDGFQTVDIVPVVVAVAGAFGVYLVPNTPKDTRATAADFR